MLRLLRAVALAALIFGLSACDAIDTASNTLDKAEVCSKALSAAGFAPDLSNPEQSVQDAQQRSQELRGLASRTADAELQRELNEMADQMGELQVSDVNPTGAAEWGQRKLDRLNRLQAACS